jgi:hypothetical protein
MESGEKESDFVTSPIGKRQEVLLPLLFLHWLSGMTTIHIHWELKLAGLLYLISVVLLTGEKRTSLILRQLTSETTFFLMNPPLSNISSRGQISFFLLELTSTSLPSGKTSLFDHVDRD